MLNEQIRFWLEIIGSAAGIIALFAIALELQRARKADTRDFYFHIAEKFDRLEEERAILYEMDTLDFDVLILIPSEDKRYKAFGLIANFWDMVSRAAHENSSDKKIALEQFGNPFYSFYSKWSYYFKGLAEIEGTSFPVGYRYLDWFAEEYLKYFPEEWEAFLKAQAYVDALQNKSSTAK